jgi:hypothetical protein
VLAEVHNPFIVKLFYSFQVWHVWGRVRERQTVAGQRGSSSSKHKPFFASQHPNHTLPHSTRHTRVTSHVMSRHTNRMTSSSTC